MNNIETGCTAIVVGGRNPKNIGKIVTVGKYLGNNPDVVGMSTKYNDYFEVDQEMIPLNLLGDKGEPNYIQNACNLHRIDDTKNIEKTEENEELTA